MATRKKIDGTFALRDLDEYTVAEGDPDPRGWDVMSSDNQKVGEVKDLLVDLQAMKVRYLDVELDHNLKGESDQHVLIPVGTARMDDNLDRVIVGIDASRTLSMPLYQRDGAVRREYEDSLFATMGISPPMPPVPGNNPDLYYERPEFDTSGFYGLRRRSHR